LGQEPTTSTVMPSTKLPVGSNRYSLNSGQAA
jgi:hypothetical protein